jgi:hypothetical protein
VEFHNKFSALNFIVQSLQTTTDGFSDTSTDKEDTDIQVDDSSESSSACDTDIDKSSESSSADETLHDASDNEERAKKTLTSTTKPIQMLKRESSVRKALEFGKDQDSNTGLLKYFSQGTKEGMDTYWKKEEERIAVNEEKKNFKKMSVVMEKKLRKRELARVHQQKKRDRIKEREVKEGVRSPGGKKRKVIQNISMRIKLTIRPRLLS